MQIGQNTQSCAALPSASLAALRQNTMRTNAFYCSLDLLIDHALMPKLVRERLRDQCA